MSSQMQKLFFLADFSEDDLIRLCDAQSKTIERQALKISELEFRIQSFKDSVMVPSDKWLEITQKASEYHTLLKRNQRMADFLRKMTAVIDQYNDEVESD